MVCRVRKGYGRELASRIRGRTREKGGKTRPEGEEL